MKIIVDGSLTETHSCWDERKRKSREKKRNELGEEEYLRQRAEKQKEWRQNRELTPAQKEEQTSIEREKKESS